MICRASYRNVTCKTISIPVLMLLPHDCVTLSGTFAENVVRSLAKTHFFVNWNEGLRAEM